MWLGAESGAVLYSPTRLPRIPHLYPTVLDLMFSLFHKLFCNFNSVLDLPSELNTRSQDHNEAYSSPILSPDRTHFPSTDGRRYASWRMDFLDF